MMTMKYYLMFLALAFADESHLRGEDWDGEEALVDDVHIRGEDWDGEEALVDDVHIRGEDWDGDEEEAVVDGSHIRGDDWDGEEVSADDGHHEREHEEEEHDLFQNKVIDEEDAERAVGEHDHEIDEEDTEDEAVDAEDEAADTEDEAVAEKPELDYAGQGTSDERARGSFDRDEEEIGKRHDTFSSPFEGEEDAEGEEAPIDEEQTEGQQAEEQNDGVTDEETEEEIEELTEEEAEEQNEERTERELDRATDADDAEEVADDEAIAMEDGEEELLAVPGGVQTVHTVNSQKWTMSVVLLTLTGAAMAALFVHLLRKCDAKKMKAVDSENTPLIANEV